MHVPATDTHAAAPGTPMRALRAASRVVLHVVVPVHLEVELASPLHTVLRRPSVRVLQECAVALEGHAVRASVAVLVSLPVRVHVPRRRRGRESTEPGAIPVLPVHIPVVVSVHAIVGSTSRRRDLPMSTRGRRHRAIPVAVSIVRAMGIPCPGRRECKWRS